MLDKNRNAKITVLMPVGSIDSHLLDSIRSLKMQTFKEFSCYVLSRKLNSTEFLILSSMISDDPRFVVHQLGLNGIAFALNYGLNLVETKYVARMDSDDVSRPERFALQLDFLEKNPQYVAVGCRVNLINEHGSKLAQEFKFYEHNEEIRYALKYRMPLCHPALMFRTDSLFAVNGYTYGNTAEDHELFLRLARNSCSLFKNLPEELYEYRRHNGQLTDLRHARNAYFNIAGFMVTEFLRTYNPLYIVGAFACHPLLRRVRIIIRVVLGGFK